MMQIQGPPGGGVRQLHIAYHNGDHYSSIRRDGDNTETPANICLQVSEREGVGKGERGEVESIGEREERQAREG